MLLGDSVEPVGDKMRQSDDAPDNGTADGLSSCWSRNQSPPDSQQQPLTMKSRAHKS